MRYDISKATAPQMPTLGKGTECIKILLSQTSKDMHEPLVPMLFPVLGAHVSSAEFQYPDLSWKELCGQMANLVAESGGNKGQLSSLVEAICRDFRQHDEEELKKLVEWQRQMKTKSANKEKPARPDVAFWFPPSDVTSAAFLQNAMACEALGERTLTRAAAPRLMRYVPSPAIPSRQHAPRKKSKEKAPLSHGIVSHRLSVSWRCRNFASSFEREAFSPTEKRLVTCREKACRSKSKKTLFFQYFALNVNPK